MESLSSLVSQRLCSRKKSCGLCNSIIKLEHSNVPMIYTIHFFPFYYFRCIVLAVDIRFITQCYKYPQRVGKEMHTLCSRRQYYSSQGSWYIHIRGAPGSLLGFGFVFLTPEWRESLFVKYRRAVDEREKGIKILSKVQITKLNFLFLPFRLLMGFSMWDVSFL